MNQSERTGEFVELLAGASRRIYSYVRTLVPNQEDAEDAYQETSKVLWQKFDEFEPGTDFCSWALSIAHFKAMQVRRKAKNSHLVLMESLEGLLSAAAIAADARHDERFSALDECVRKLPEADQLLIDARYLQGARVRAIAEQEGKSLDAIYRSLRRVHKVLFDCIRSQLGEEESS